jgi:hypothetical protein
MLSLQEVASLLEEAVVTTFDDVDSGANDTITTKRRAKLVRFYRSSKIYVIDLMHGDVCCAVGPLLPACFARIEYEYSQSILVVVVTQHSSKTSSDA